MLPQQCAHEHGGRTCRCPAYFKCLRGQSEELDAQGRGVKVVLLLRTALTMMFDWCVRVDGTAAAVCCWWPHLGSAGFALHASPFCFVHARTEAAGASQW